MNFPANLLKFPSIFSRKNEGLEVAVVPTFVKNFITFAKSAVGLQQNFARFSNSRDLVQNIVDNSNRHGLSRVLAVGPFSSSFPLLDHSRNF